VGTARWAIALSVLVGICHLAQGQTESALELYQAGLKAEGRHDLEQAAKSYEKALAAEPRFVDAHSALAWALLVSGQIDKAQQHFEVLSRSDDSLVRAEAQGALRGLQARGHESLAAVPAAEFVGDMETRKVHHPPCAALKDRPPYLLIPFESLGDAIHCGYKPCLDCRADPGGYYAHFQSAQSQADKRNQIRHESLVSRILLSQSRAEQEHSTATAYSAQSAALYAEGQRVRRNIGLGTVLAIKYGLAVSTTRQRERLQEAANCEKVAAFLAQRASAHQAYGDWQQAHADQVQRRLGRAEAQTQHEEQTQQLRAVETEASGCIARAVELGVAGDFVNGLRVAAMIADIIPEDYAQVAGKYGYGASELVRRIAYMFYVRGKEEWEQDDLLLALADWGNALSLAAEDPLYADAVRKADAEIERRTAAQVAQKVLEEANKNWGQGNRDKAIEQYLQCAEVAPTDWTGMKDVRTAIEDAGRTIAENAGKLAKDRKFANALQEYDVALKLLPGDRGIQESADSTKSEWSAALEKTGDQGFEDRDYTAAAKAYSHALELTPDREGLKQKLASARSGPEQVAAVKEALADPWSAGAQLQALKNCKALGEFGLAMHEMQVETRPRDNWGLNSLLMARLLTIAGDDVGARKSLDVWCSHNSGAGNGALPEGRSGIVDLAKVSVPTTDQAQKCGQEHADDPLAAVLLASVHFERGHDRDIEPALESVLAASANFGPSQLLASYVRFWADAAPKGASRQDIESALSHAVWAVGLDPENRLALLQCAALYLVGQAPTEADYYLSRAEKLAPDDPRCQVLRAVFHIEKGEADEALTATKGLIKYELYPASAHFLAACAHLLNNDTRKASLAIGRATKYDRSYYSVSRPELGEDIVRVVRQLVPSTPEFIRVCASSTTCEDVPKVDSIPEELLFCLSGPEEVTGEGG